MPFMTSSLQLSSPAFTDNGLLPVKYAFRGDNVSPPLQIGNIPYGTRSMMLIMHAPNTTSGDWLHWSIYNISRDVTEIAENSAPNGALEGVVSTGRIGYSGPNPPQGSGIRQYIFELYALPVIFELEYGADRMTLEQQLRSVHILGQTKLTALFTNDTPSPTQAVT